MRRPYDRFCKLAVEYVGVTNQVEARLCNFRSASDEFETTFPRAENPVVDRCWPHSVFDEPDFRSLWEAEF